jgi:hypothetical protein
VFERVKILPRWLQWIGGVAGVFVAVFGAIAGAPPAMNALDDAGFYLASRLYVRNDRRGFETALTSIQIDSIDGKIEAAEAAHNKLELDQLGYDTVGQIKALQEMRRLATTIDLLREKRRNIKGERGPN